MIVIFTVLAVPVPEEEAALEELAAAEDGFEEEVEALLVLEEEVLCVLEEEAGFAAPLSAFPPDEPVDGSSWLSAADPKESTGSDGLPDKSGPL